MQDYDLKNPGDNQQAQTLRLNTARALSIAKNEANPSKALADFLLDAATKAPKYVKPAPDPLPADQKVVKTGDRINIKDKDGNPATTTAELTVSNGVVSGAFIASGVAIIPTAVKQSVGAVTGTGTFATFTVVNGAITAIVLSDA